MLVAAMAGCDEQAGGYLPASALAHNGFLSDEVALAGAQDREVRLWGLVDQGNLYGDAGAAAGRPTKVLVTGRLFSFRPPTRLL